MKPYQFKRTSFLRFSLFLGNTILATTALADPPQMPRAFQPLNVEVTDRCKDGQSENNSSWGWGGNTNTIYSGDKSMAGNGCVLGGTGWDTKSSVPFSIDPDFIDSNNGSNPKPKTQTAYALIIDLDGNGIEFIQRTESSTLFDLNGDGKPKRTAWVGNGDGLLVIDLDDAGGYNADGRIHMGREVAFSHWTANASSGLEAIRLTFDTNRNGLLDAGDQYFSNFRIWIDRDANGISKDSESFTLANLDIVSIKLSHFGEGWSYPDGSSVIGTALANRNGGSSILVADMRFSTATAPPEIEINNTTTDQGQIIIDYKDGGSSRTFIGEGDLSLAYSLGHKGWNAAVLTYKDGASSYSEYYQDGNIKIYMEYRADETLARIREWDAHQMATEWQYNSDGVLSDTVIIGTDSNNSLENPSPSK